MPIYEYKCNDCDSKFEELVFSDAKKVVCGKCGSENAEKLLSGFATNGNTIGASESCGNSGGFS
ncbi:MAG: zinc ribbon domain-containing protein [candidate division Zixibacteria bacterium]